MNRHERRRTRKMGQNAFYQSYVAHLPQVPLDAPIEPGVHHLVCFHDEWCRIYVTGNSADCNCNPTLRRHIEPRRS